MSMHVDYFFGRHGIEIFCVMFLRLKCLAIFINLLQYIVSYMLNCLRSLNMFVRFAIFVKCVDSKFAAPFLSLGFGFSCSLQL